MTISVAFPKLGALVITLPTASLVARLNPGSFVVNLTAVPGPKGDPGAAGNRYVHSQVTPSQVWTVAHNLGRRPLVMVTDHLGNQLAADVQHLNDTTLQVTHSVNLIGYVFCS